MNNHVRDCPVCGRELDVPPHTRGTPWTPKQLWLARRLQAIGLKPAGIAYILHTTTDSVRGAIQRANAERL